MMVSILKVYKYENRYFLDGFQLLEFGKEDLIKGTQEQLYEFPFPTIQGFAEEYEIMYGEEMKIEFRELYEDDLINVYQQPKRQH